MEPEPIPPQPRQIQAAPSSSPSESETGNMFFTLHYPAYRCTFRLHGRSVKVRICGMALMFAALIAGIAAGKIARGDEAKALAFLNTLMGMIPGYLAYSFGAYLSACAEHHRSSLINAILNSPHLSLAGARAVINRLEKGDGD